jgi:hypothetical protein
VIKFFLISASFDGVVGLRVGLVVELKVSEAFGGFSCDSFEVFR